VKDLQAWPRLPGQTRRQGAGLYGQGGNGWSRTTSSQIRKQLTRASVPSPKLTKAIESRRQRGLSRPSPPRWSTATSPPKACCGKARSWICLGTKN